MIYEQLWKLRTDPFYPTVDDHGVAIEKSALEECLDPSVDAKVIPLYFDIYDWSNSHLVSGICRNDVLKTFPTSRTLRVDGPLVVLISGRRQTGLDSMAHLIEHKIRRVSGKDVLICDLELETKDDFRNVAAVASCVVNRVKRHKPSSPELDVAAKEIKEHYREFWDEHKDLRDANCGQLFRNFQDSLQPCCLELVVKINSNRDGDSWDSWVRISKSVKSCCSYVLIMTASDAHAKTCYESMIGDGENVTWIRALPLGLEAAKKYVETRLLAERIATNPFPQATLFPFSDDAIEVLYEPGQTYRDDVPIEYSIGWLRKTFHQAIIGRVNEISKAHSNIDTATLSTIRPGDACIDGKRMRDVRELLNHGSARNGV